MRQGIVGTGVRVLRGRPRLLGFPVLSAVTMALVVAAVWALPVEDAHGLRGVWQRARDGHAPTSAQGAGLVLLLALLTCVNTYYNAALLHSVHSLESGARPTVGASLRAALRLLPVLVGWSLLNLTVGRVLRTANSVPVLSALLRMTGLVWSLVSYFMLPVLVVERVGLWESLRRSRSLGPRQAGNWLAGGNRLLIVLGLAVILGVACLILAVESEDRTLLLAVAGWVLALWLLFGLMSATVTGIYRMTLYRQAVGRA
jgi:hypothetical protein